MKRWAFAFFSCLSCTRGALPPRGEALIVVDTDLPVPRVIARLRIEVLDEQGSVIATREDPRPDPRDWPVSFSVYTDDESHPHRSWIRLRAFADRSTPDPSITVDRMLRVELVPGKRGRVVVTLRGDCAGLAATLEESCVDGALEPVNDAILEPTLSRSIASAVGEYRVQSCTEAPLHGRVCVPGGAFVLGDAFYRTEGGLEVRPERIVALSRFSIDEDEVSVGTWRGFSTPYAPGTGEGCTFSPTTGAHEDDPLNCVPWVGARAYCQAHGGDLPTEAQWEYAAVAAGRATKTLYPWGDDAPSCDRAVYGRALDKACGDGLLPLLPVNADVNPLGARNLAGSLSELMRDDYVRYDDPCFASSLDPACVLPLSPACAQDPLSETCQRIDSPTKSVRGGSWASNAYALRTVDRSRQTSLTTTTDVLSGFRCVYPTP
jgi:formylglycine-generating enzyme required for sulfatase activity